MSDLDRTEKHPVTAEAASSRRGTEDGVVQPLSKADPSVSARWDEHVHEYFNQDAHPGEAVPMATHEAKE